MAPDPGAWPINLSQQEVDVTNDSNTLPQWQPPTHLRDPFVRRFHQHRVHWSRASRGRIPDLREQAIAARLADYANKDGSNAHPGVARLAQDTCSSEKTVRRALSWLSENGWIRVTHRGRRKLGEADVYQLSVPAPVAAELGWWPAGEVQWIERPSGEPKRPELRRERVKFPAVNSDRDKQFLAVISNFLEVTDGVVEVNDDLPPGPSHQDLSSPRRDSISAPVASDRGSYLPDLDPGSEDYIDALHDHIVDQLGGSMHPTVETMVDGMVSAGAHWKMIVRTALARERDGRTAS